MRGISLSNNPVINANFESVGTNQLPTGWLVRTGSEYAVISVIGVEKLGGLQYGKRKIGKNNDY
jgi:hypothetical protein